MEKENYKEILRQQLELLSEVSKSESAIPYLADITEAMVRIVKLIEFYDVIQ